MLFNEISINNLNFINKEHILLLYPSIIYAILCYPIKMLRLIMSYIKKLKIKMCNEYIEKD